MIRKLQIKFVIINMTIVTIMLSVILGLVYYFTGNRIEHDSIRMMKNVAADPFRQSLPNMQSQDLRLPYFILLLGSKGELVSTVGDYYDLSDQEFLKELIAEAAGSRLETGIMPRFGLRFYRYPTQAGQNFVFSDISSETHTMNNLMKTSLTIGILSFFGFLVISIFLSKWAVKPVEEAWLQQKKFVGDASHELKTPLTVIMTNAELLQNEEYGIAERRKFSQNILLMSRQMKLLVEKMLELARSESAQTERPMNPVDFSELVLTAALSFEGVFVEKGLTLEYSAEPGITVSGNEQALQQLLNILLDNAQKYSSPGGETAVRLYSSGHGKCRLKVSNPGAEIAQEDLKKIFRSFCRLDDARSRDGSFGLGLSIAESIVTQHRGSIWAESENGMNTFSVELRKHR